MIDPNHLLTLGTSLLTFMGGLFGYLKLRQGQQKASTRDKAQDRTIDSIHILVNDRMGRTLRLAAQLAQRLSDLTHDPADEALARNALHAADAHDTKQRLVDGK